MMLDRALQARNPPRKSKNVLGFGDCAWLAVIEAGKLRYPNFRALKLDVRNFARDNKHHIQKDLEDKRVLLPHQSTDDDWWAAVERELTTDGVYANETTIQILALFLHADHRIFDIETTLPNTVPGSRHWAQHLPLKATIELGYRRDQQMPIFNAEFRAVGHSAGHYWAITLDQGNQQPSAAGRR